MADLISRGALTEILDNKRPANPILQIIGYKPMTSDQLAFGSGSKPEDPRYRLMIGDGQHAHQYCVITNQDLVNDLKQGRLEKWSLIRVTSYQTVDYPTEGPSENKRRLIYILNLEVVKKGSEIGSKITCQASNNQPMNASDRPQFRADQQQPAYQQPSYQQSSYQQPQVMQPNSINLNSNFNRPYDNQQQPQIRPQSNNYMQNNYGEPTQPQPYPIGGGMQPNMITSPRSNRGGYEQQVIGIGELTPYIGKWIVKGRVVTKSVIRDYSNAKGSGKLFNFTFADKTGEIKVTAFNADCERVYGYVEPNKVYYLGRASVKPANKAYTNADFEMTLNSDSILEEVIDSREASDVPLAQFKFQSIGTISNLPENSIIDLCGAITEVSEPGSVISRTKNKELRKRNITIVDISRHTISVTIWGPAADTFIGVEGDVFVTKAARVGTYGGRSVSAGDSIFINPDIPETRKIRTWYEKLLERNFTPLTSSQDGPAADQWKTLDQMLNIDSVKQAISTGSKSANYGKCKAMLMSVGKNPIYKCCPQDGCGKKLVDTQNGELKCDKCQQTYTNFKYRYMTSVEISDQTSSAWVTLWDNNAESVLGLKPEELQRLMVQESKDEYERIITRPNFRSFTLTLRSNIDTYNNEEKVRLNVVGVLQPLDPVIYSKKLIEEIKCFVSS